VIRLQRARIGALVRQNKAGRIAQYMGMHFKADLGSAADALDKLSKARNCERCTALRHENEGRLGFALQDAQCSQFIAEQRMCSRCSALGAANMKGRGFKLDIRPSQFAELTSPQGVMVSVESIIINEPK
jgi:hypothetical protein